ncbi:MAG: DUF6516 family protein [Mariprofundales bacterium]
MVKKKPLPFLKIVDERYNLPKHKGGGLIRIEAWENSNNIIIKYNISYINFALCQVDNGRVFGYDNAHDYHHKHFFGKITPINFISYETLVEQFEKEIKEYIQ